MVELVQEYLAYRRHLGYGLRSQGTLLMAFAKHADRIGHRGPVTIELALQWAQRGTTRGYQVQKLAAVRAFAKYRSIFEPTTEVPSRCLLGRAHFRTTPHIYSQAEIDSLLAAARRLTPKNGIRPHTYVTLFGLLASTGLRLSEALKLVRSDIDWKQSLLTVRMTKFRKSRLVSLHSSTILAMRSYAETRDRSCPFPQTDRFFVASQGKILSRTAVRCTFRRRLRPALGPLARCGRSRAPRIHDLRHTFACRRLLQWYKEGVDIDHSIAALSTYLGHVGVTSTYWYLTGVPELFKLTMSRFEHFASSKLGDLV